MIRHRAGVMIAATILLTAACGTDTPSLPEFVTTGLLAPGGEQSFVMNTLGTMTFHCTIHPQIVGTLIVEQR